MVYKLGTLSDLHRISSADSKVKEVIAETLKTLDDNYGKDRDVDNDYGGYVLYAEPGTRDTEVLSWFDYEEYVPEYVEYVGSDPEYCCSLYLTSTEYGVVVLTALADTPEEITDELQG